MKKNISYFLQRTAIFLLPMVGANNLLHAQGGLPMVQLKIGPHSIHAEVADNPTSRQYGLMNRTSLPADQGMLFVFERPGMHCFWMRNTLIPLAIAFIRQDGTIVNLKEMQPQTETTHCPDRAVRYALEMNQGWFRKKGIKSGMQVTNLP